MLNFLSRISSPTALLYVFITLTQIAGGIDLASHLEPHPAFTLISAFGFVWLIGWWLLRDSRKRGVAWIFDMGLFLYLAWPFVMPYYLLKTRGAKGLLVILGFAGVFIGATVAGMALFWMLAPQSG